MKHIVMVDPGHGGEDSGYPARIKDDAGKVVRTLNEKDLNLTLGLLLGGFLHLKGAEVFYTRQRDEFVSLGDRQRKIRDLGPDAFISIHNNADDEPEAHGFEIFYRDAADKPLAEAVGHYLRRTDLHERGIFQDVERLGKHLAVLNNLEAPAILVECGFMTFPSDLKYVIENKASLAQVIAAGVMDFLGEVA